MDKDIKSIIITFSQGSNPNSIERSVGQCGVVSIRKAEYSPQPFCSVVVYKVDYESGAQERYIESHLASVITY